MVSTSKNVHHAYIQPGALARGRGYNFGYLGSVKTSIGKRNLIGENKNRNSTASEQNKLAHANNLVPPGFASMEDDAPLAQDPEAIQETGATLKNIHHAYIQPAALARGRGKSFQSLGSAKINVLKKNIICEIKNYNSRASKHNKLAHSCNNLMPPGFDTMEEDIPFTQEAEMMQEVGAILKNVRDTYNQPSALARGCGKNLRSSGSAKGSVGKRNMVGESKNHNSTASEQNTLAHNSTNLMPPSFDQMEDDVSLAQEDEMMQDLCELEEPKKVRGKNKNKDVAGLKPGEKFRVNFYNNRVVGKHQASFSRHLGILVRDRNMCLLQVHSWKDIGEDKLEHMWRTVTDKFDSDDMNHQRDHVLKHMNKLWTNWRGALHKYVKFKPLHEALKDVPKEVDKSDWEWLVKEYFLSEKFKETSIRNSINRSKLRIPHRTGSKPIREIIYELAEIQELVQSEPALTNIEVIERCFGPQNKSHMVGLGGGITTKELKGGSSSKTAILIELNATRKEKESLQAELNATKKSKESLEKCMDDFESKYDHLISLLVDQPSSAPSTSQQSTS